MLSKQVETLMADMPVMKSQVNAIVDVLDGPEVRALDGTTYRDKKDGVRFQIAQLYDDSQNGGVRARLSRIDRFFIAGIGALAVLGAGWIAAL